MGDLCLLFMVLVYLKGGHNIDRPAGREWQEKRHDINSVDISITNYATFGYSMYGIGCLWPKGSGHGYIYGAGFWFGTVDSLTGDTLVTEGYHAWEFAPGIRGMSPDSPCAIIYLFPDPWPPPYDTFPMAPQDTVSGQDAWCCFNDCDSAYHTPGDRSIGIEMYQTVYGWNVPDIQDVVFFMLESKNVSGHNLHDCYFGIYADCDIGNESGTGNDQMAGIIGRWYVIGSESLWCDNCVYQWQDELEPGSPPWQPGTIGFDLLQTSFNLQVGQDKDGDGILDQYERDSAYYWNNLPQDMWDVDHDGVPDWRDASENPQLGMTALRRFRDSIFEPNNDPDRYLTLAGYNYVTGQYEPYDTLSSEPDDQRFLMSSGPFDLAPDSSIIMVFAILFADWHDIYQTPDTALILVDKLAQCWYDMYWFEYVGVEEHVFLMPLNTELLVQPNPISRSTIVSFSLNRAGRVSMKLYNTLGQVVKNTCDGPKSAGNYTITLDTHGLAQGTYLLVLETPEGKTSRSLVVLR